MKRLIVLFSLLISSFASAGILIEPQLGYILSNKVNGTANLVNGATTATLDADSKATGVEYGARLGYSMLGFMGGLNFGKVSGKITDNTDGSKDDYKGTNLGAFVGYSAPILVRAWFAYNFSSKADIGADSVKGKSTEFGIGYTGLPFLSINFIYRMYDMDEITASGTTYSASGYKPKEMELAISAPFNLF